jgi:hypothetical protein
LTNGGTGEHTCTSGITCEKGGAGLSSFDSTLNFSRKETAMIRRTVRTVVLCIFLSQGLQANAQEYQVGIGRIDITPKGPIWMAGYGNRNKPSEGIEQHLFLKALALQQGGQTPVVLVTADIIGFPRTATEEIADRLQKDARIPRENFMAVASHTHTGPVIDSGLKGMFDLQGEAATAVKDYARQLVDAGVQAAKTALGAMSPARLSMSHGNASFAMNRRVFRPNGVNFGANPDGPVDHDVPVLRIEDPTGKIRAMVFGYACHCTTLTGDCYRISGDWAGYAAEFLERAHPDATAFFLTGCGADADPQPRGKIDLAREHGLEMAGAVSRALKGSHTPIAGPIKTAFDRANLPFARLPGRGEFEKKLQDQNAFVRRHARQQLELLDRDGKLPASYLSPVQVWQFGDDLTLVAMGGEVVVDYDLRLKHEFPKGKVWCVGYANDVFAYVPSVRILLEGGYEADYAMIYYGLPTRFSNDVENVLVGKVHELARKTQAAK